MFLFVLVPVVVVIILLIVSARPPRLKLAAAHVLVSGGSTGIGLEIAKECAKKGAFVSIVARNEKNLDKAKIEIEKCSTAAGEKQCMTHSLDISKSADKVKDAVSHLERSLGPVDILINCAGISHAEAFETTPVEKFEQLMQVNYLGAVYCTKAVLPGMKLRRRGRIVFVSSQAGQTGVFGFTAYSATKFALRGLAETLQMEVKPYNIGITISFPPDTDTEAFRLENENKPEETRLISETAGVFTPDKVAKSIIEDTLTGEFMSTVGLDGFILGHLTSGMAPSNSAVSAFCQVMLMGWFRIVALAYLKKFDMIVARCAAAKKFLESSSGVKLKWDEKE